MSNLRKTILSQEEKKDRTIKSVVQGLEINKILTVYHSLRAPQKGIVPSFEDVGKDTV